MKTHLLTIALLTGLVSNAATYQVGASRVYKTPNALYLANVVQNGDTIEIDPETYSGTACLAQWKPNNLYIKGLVGRSKAHMKANGKYILGKGIWVLGGKDITVDNIEFSEASVPDKNGAGIRLDRTGMTVRHCYFHDNENGILTSNPYAGDILIEYTEFNKNGYGDGFTHNLYIGHVNKLTFRYNYSHHAYIGHNLKSRAEENFIYYNRIMDEALGESSRLIDLPNGGFSIIMGNVLMQGPKAKNNNLFGYGLEGLSNSRKEFHFINNTLLNKRKASCIFLSIKAGTTVAQVKNNIFTGTGTVISGSTTAMSNNSIYPAFTDMKFVNEVSYDYHLQKNSPAIDSGAVVTALRGYSLTPISSYAHLTSSEVRTNSSTIDAGAYEFNTTNSNATIEINKLMAYPNPFSDRITLDGVSIPKSKIHIYNLLGQSFSDQIKVQLEGNKTYLNTSKLPKGFYVLRSEAFAKMIYKE